MRMTQAGMAELAYASDLKSDDRYDLVGSSPTPGIFATVAQLAEQRFCKPQVAGSSPVGGFGGQCFSPVTQLVEWSAVNRYVAGSSPAGGVSQSVAQLGSAPHLGCGGRRFKSYHSDC